MAILEQNVLPTKQHGAAIESGFSMDFSLEAFEIMSDRIYPNKIKAVVRELATNGNDAQIDARKLKVCHNGFNCGDSDAVIADELIATFNLSIDERDRVLRRVAKERIRWQSGEFDMSKWQWRDAQVHLPNHYEPWYSIRDFGTGLGFSVYPRDPNTYKPVWDECLFYGSIESANEFAGEANESYPNGVVVVDETMSMYTTYFRSNKNDSNDYTGCLGLGSKSPFAYNDTFTVEVHFEGKKRQYTAYLKDGRPTMSVVADDDGNPMHYDTDEPNGLLVKFPVREEDFDRFADEAKALLPYFQNIPEVIGDHEVADVLNDIKQSKESGEWYIVQGEGWGIRPVDNNGPRAVMGNIAYPIQGSSLRYKTTDDMDRLLACDIDIIFPVGSLDITPSREVLSYDDKTIDNIIGELGRILAEVREEINKFFDDAECLWDARCWANDLYSGRKSDLGQLGRLASMRHIEWHGQNLGSSEVYFERDELEDNGVSILRFYRKAKRGSWRYDQSNYSVAKSDANGIPCTHDIKIFEADIPRGVQSRARKYTTDSTKDCYIVRFDDKDAKEWFIEQMGMKVDQTFEKVSSLPKPDRSIYAGSRYSNSSQVFVHKGDHREKARYYEHWRDVDADFDLNNDGGVYVEMCRYKCRKHGDKDREYDPDTIGDIMRLIGFIDDEGTPEVIGVRSQMAKLFRKSDDWVDLWTYGHNVLSNLVTNHDLERHIANVKQWQDFSNADDWENMLHYVGDDLDDSPLYEFLGIIRDVKASVGAIKNPDWYIQLGNYVGTKLEHRGKGDHTDTETSLADLEQLALADYPMLRTFIKRAGIQDSQDAKAACDYVKTIDNS